MVLSSATSYVCDQDLENYIEDFFRERPSVANNFVKYINDEKLYSKLLDTAIEKRILTSNVRAKVSKSGNGAITLLNAFKQKMCTLGMLCECIKGNDLSELFGILGIFGKMFVIGQTGPLIHGCLGQELMLSFLVEGYPKPTFKWYYNGTLLPSATESTLILSNFRKETEGRYYCIATQQSSNSILGELISNTIECILRVSQPVILQDLPPVLACPEGEEVTFKIKADEFFVGDYEWYYMKDTTSIFRLRSNTNYFTIESVIPEQVGNYKCVLINSAGEAHSTYCTLKVDPPYLRPSGKYAFLFGSCQYTNFSNLKQPSGDINLLSAQLKSLGFEVYSFSNKSKNETDRIISQLFSSLPKHSFVFFYLSGHGFKLANNNYFIPVDCPPSGQYTTDDCLHHQFIIKEIMQTEPLLLISVLDMCLAAPDKDSNPQLFNESLKHHGYIKPALSHLVEVCTTSDYQKAYEKKSQNYGLYCVCLCKYIMNDLPIDDIFRKVNDEFVKRDKGHQCPQFKSSLGVVHQYFRLNMKTKQDLRRQRRSHDWFEAFKHGLDVW